MPDSISLRQIGIWFCVGFFTASGWFIASVIVSRIFARII